ncbi:MAG: diguanylate cyclase [Mariprofundaceae bacterium]|nr:diguanylate cyclase [Mariprofundaceae bacterium]
MVSGQLHEAIESLTLLRMRVLRTDPKNNDLRSSFREISHHLESIQQQKPISSDEFRQLAIWLGQFLDADFGTRISHYEEMSEAERNALLEHIQQRREVLQQAEHAVPLLQTAIGKCLTTLNKSADKTPELDKQARLLASALKDHMHDDERLRKALNGLIAAMQKSLENITESLGDMGGELPELAETQTILEQELPDDPKEAKAMLHKARANILRAGKKVGQAGKVIHQALESQRSQVQEMSKSLNRAEHDAQHDVLTGLGNRRKLAAFVNTLGNRTATFLLVDIDYFKKVNDRYGHDSGDEVLSALAQILTENVRASDLVVRLGGEEFAAILTDVNAENSFDIAETLRRAIEACPFKCSKGKLPITVSIGLSTRKTGETVAHWIQRSDKALYQAKQNGRNRTEVSLG